jgi:hypothetical protein
LDLNVPDHIHFSNIVLLVVIVLLLRPQLRRWWRRLREHWRDHQPRRWKPAALCGNEGLRNPSWGQPFDWLTLIIQP